ncbi:MAG: YceD family protein [Hyphomicrobiaceae bacterium]
MAEDHDGNDPAAGIPEQPLAGPRWQASLASIPPAGLKAHVRASEQELLAIARALDIPAAREFALDYELRPLSRGRYRLKGRIAATLVEACIVTLEPVIEEIAEVFSVEFRPEPEGVRADRPPKTRRRGAAPPAESPRPVPREIDLGDLEEEAHEPITGQAIDFGRVAFEELAIAMNPYPRADGADLDRTTSGTPDEEGEEETPFAGLRRIRPPE